MTSDYRPPVRTDLVGVSPYGAPHLTSAIPLHVNENPFPPSEQMVAAITAAVREVASTLNRYPDREAVGLRTALGAYLAADAGQVLPPDRMWVGNGSNEVMQHCLTAFGGPGRAMLTFDPTYSMYPQYARDTFTEHIQGSRRGDFSIDPSAAQQLIADHQPALTVIASPNNPTGTRTPIDLVADLAQWASGGLVIVDEAYAEFRDPDHASALTLIDEYPNLVVVRTMSKAFGFAGARVGYLAAAPEVVDALRVVRLPYHVSAITQAVAQAALQFAGDLAPQIDVLRRERALLASWLREQGMDVAESDANFLLFGRFVDRDAVWQAVLDRGVLIRQVGPPGWLRVSVGTPEQNAIFRDILDSVLPHVAREGS